MSPDQEHRLEEIFSAARELPPPERTTFLDRVCGGDAELRRQADSLLAAREQAGQAFATTSRLRRGVFRWALAGFGLGVVAASAYLLLGGEYFVFIPRWAEIVFYPGFLVGFKVNDWGLSEQSSKVVGVLALGLAYAAAVVFVRLAWFAIKHRRQSAAAKQISE